MKGLFWLSLLLSHLCGTESTENEPSCLLQPRKIFRKTGQSAVLPCTVFNCSSESRIYQWFVFREKHHFGLTLTSRHSLDGASLQISSLNTNDSGIYHCAITSKSKTECCRHHVGLGTTLVVKEHLKPQLRQTLLWLSFVLLVIYSLALVAFIILKKHGCRFSICKKPSRNKANSVRKTTQFRDVLQELHSRGTFTKSKQTRRDRSRVEEASGESNISTDDIYQNV